MPTEHFNRFKLCRLNVENFESAAFRPLLLRSSKKINSKNEPQFSTFVPRKKMIRKTNHGSLPSFLEKK